MNDFEVIKTESICRSCLKESDSMHSIFSTVNDSMLILQMLVDCASVQVDADDGLPEHLCHSCMSDLNIAFNFKQRCQENDQKLRDYISGTYIETLDEAYEETKPPDEPIGDETNFFDDDYNDALSDISDKFTDPFNEMMNEEKSNDMLKSEFVKIEGDDDDIPLNELVKSKIKIRKMRKTKVKKELELDENGEPIKAQKISCYPCGNRFKSLEALQKHIEKQGCGKTKKNVCDLCNKEYSTASSLRIHKRRHSGIFSFLCPVCGKKFVTAGDLREHVNRHQNEKPYHCDVCKKGLTSTAGLRIHMLRHTGDKPHTCKICSIKFRTTQALRVHMFSHTGVKQHKCQVCTSAFATRGDLRRHMFIHTGEKPFRCHYCHVTFARHSTLRQHEYSHTGEEPFECKQCNRRFRHSSTYYRHINLKRCKGLQIEILNSEDS